MYAMARETFLLEDDPQVPTAVNNRCMDGFKQKTDKARRDMGRFLFHGGNDDGNLENGKSRTATSGDSFRGAWLPRQSLLQ